MRKREKEKLFRELFDETVRRVQAFFKKQGFSIEEVEELTQDTFLRVYEYVGRYRGGSKRAFVMSIAGTIWKNELRRRDALKRPKETAYDVLPPHLEQSSPWPGISKNPEEEALEREEAELDAERVRQVRAAIESFPPRMKQCLLLRLECLTYRQIALAMKASIDAVKKLLHEARKRLKRELGSWAEEQLDQGLEVDDDD